MAGREVAPDDGSADLSVNKRVVLSTPAERLDGLVAWLEFLEEARAALQRAR